MSSHFIKSSDVEVGQHMYASHQVMYSIANSQEVVNLFKRVIKAAKKTGIKEMRERLQGTAKTKPIMFMLRSIKRNGTSGQCCNYNPYIAIEVDIKHNRTLEKMALTVAHELVHAEQYLSKRLGWDKKASCFKWEGKINKNKGSTHERYMSQPWEQEAFALQSLVAAKIVSYVHAQENKK